MKVKNDHRSKFSNLSNWKEEAWKKKQGFNGIRTRDLRVSGALLYQLSYEATHWERGQYIEFISIYCDDPWSAVSFFLQSVSDRQQNFEIVPFQFMTALNVKG